MLGNFEVSKFRMKEIHMIFKLLLGYLIDKCTKINTHCISYHEIIYYRVCIYNFVAIVDKIFPYTL